MEKLKAIQTIKELEGLAKFNVCPEYIRNALALIKELTEVVEQSETARGRKESIDNGFSPSVTELQRENERLTTNLVEQSAENVMLIGENKRLRDTAYRLECEVHRERADTVRKMQERLKTYFGTYILGYKIPLTETLKIIDQIAKEVLEGKDGNS